MWSVSLDLPQGKTETGDRLKIINTREKIQEKNGVIRQTVTKSGKRFK